MSRECTICKVIKDELEFWQSHVGSVIQTYEEKKKALELAYQHLWIKKDGSKITDPWKIVHDHKHYACDKCRKEKLVKEFAIYGSKYNPKLSKVCKICNNYRRKANETRKRGKYKEERYWNGHLRILVKSLKFALKNCRSRPSDIPSLKIYY